MTTQTTIVAEVRDREGDTRLFRISVEELKASDQGAPTLAASANQDEPAGQELVGAGG